MVNDLRTSLAGQKIKHVILNSPKQVTPAVPKFKRLVAGAKILNITRRAKVIVFTLDNGWVMAGHMKMTGQFVYRSRSGRLKGGGHPFGIKGLGLPNKYTQAQFEFRSGDTLYFNDTRKFGYLKLFPKKIWDKFSLSEWGIDPLAKEFTAQALAQWPKRRLKISIKQLIMDQSLLAGVGNIYADESLFKARIKPQRKAVSLTIKETKALVSAIKIILRLAVKHRGTTMNDYLDGSGQPGRYGKYLKVYGRAGRPCVRCGHTLSRTVVGGRGTVFCQHCQT